MLQGDSQSIAHFRPAACFHIANEIKRSVNSAVSYRLACFKQGLGNVVKSYEVERVTFFQAQYSTPDSGLGMANGLTAHGTGFIKHNHQFAWCGLLVCRIVS